MKLNSDDSKETIVEELDVNLTEKQQLEYTVKETSKLHWTIFNNQVKTSKRYSLARSGATSIQLTPTDLENPSKVKQDEKFVTLTDAGTSWLGIGLDNWQSQASSTIAQ